VTDLGHSVLTQGWSVPGSLFVNSPVPACLLHEAHGLIVKPDLEIVAPPDLSLDRLFLLARFCRVRKVDVVTTLEIARESMRAALDRGMRQEQFLDLLTQSSSVPVPPTVMGLVEECAAKHGEVEIRAAGGCLTVSDPLTLKELCSNPRLAALIRDVVDERTALLAPHADFNKVKREVQKAGLMPRVEEGVASSVRGEKCHLVLSPQEYHDLVAALKFFSIVDSTLGSDLSRGRIADLERKLTSDPLQPYEAQYHVGVVTRGLEKRYREALNKRLKQITGKYKMHLAELLNTAFTSRPTRKLVFNGVNPATEPGDIQLLLEYAREHELDVTIRYAKPHEVVSIIFRPKGFEGPHVYGEPAGAASDCAYALERIVEAHLKE
jgi:hypothetical protein